MKEKMKPFTSREECAYWGGGFIAPATQGGFYSLHVSETPSGPIFFHIGKGGSREGWPADLRERYVWSAPPNGGRRCICIMQ